MLTGCWCCASAHTHWEQSSTYESKTDLWRCSWQREVKKWKSCLTVVASKHSCLSFQVVTMKFRSNLTQVMLKFQYLSSLQCTLWALFSVPQWFHLTWIIRQLKEWFSSAATSWSLEQHVVALQPSFGIHNVFSKERGSFEWHSKKTGVKVTVSACCFSFCHPLKDSRKLSQQKKSGRDSNTDVLRGNWTL